MISSKKQKKLDRIDSSVTGPYLTFSDQHTEERREPVAYQQLGQSGRTEAPSDGYHVILYVRLANYKTWRTIQMRSLYCKCEFFLYGQPSHFNIWIEGTESKSSTSY
jgi:hypothetical protein